MTYVKYVCSRSRLSKTVKDVSQKWIRRPLSKVKQRSTDINGGKRTFNLSIIEMHKASFFLLMLTLAICASIFLSPVFSSSPSPCGSCHGGYSQYLDILEGNAGNSLPSMLSVGQTSTVRVVIENRVNTAKYTALSSVSLTLTSLNGHFTVAAPTFTVGTLQKGTATATWQITAVSVGADSLVIRASGRNSHQSLSFSDSYSPAPVISVASPPSPPPSTYTVTVQSSPSGATSPTAGAYTYNSGTTVTITATPNVGYQFASWTVNGASNTANPLTLTVTSAMTITPVFTPIPLSTYTVTLQSSINGATSPAAGTYTHTSGNSVTFTAAPSSGYQFDSWTVNGATYMNNPLTITIAIDTTVTPNFVLIPPPPTPPPTPTNYTVTMQSSPNGSTAPAAGIYTFPWGSPVTFTATPSSGYGFDHWIVKNASNIANPLDLTITSDLVISPVFKILSPSPQINPIASTYTVTVQPALNGTTIPSAGTYSYTFGGLMVLNAMTNAGHKFDYWVINEAVNASNPLTLEVTSNTTVVPIFSLAISPPIAPAPTVQENQTSNELLTKNLTITIVSPTAGEKWQVGTTHEIEWETIGGTTPLNITLEYSSSNTSRRWTVIANNLADKGSLAWTIPNALTTCYIRASVFGIGTEPQNATAQVEIELSPLTPNFQAFLSTAILLPFVIIAAIFQKRENASIKSTPISSKS